MNGWLCKECFELEDEALEQHIQAHARAVPWSYDEVKQAVHELREQYRHCFACQDRIDRDLGDVAVVPVSQPRRSGHQSTAEAFEEVGRAWSNLVTEVGKAFEPLTKYLEPPINVMERALQSRKNLSNGPARPSGQNARRPRKHR